MWRLVVLVTLVIVVAGDAVTDATEGSATALLSRGDSGTMAVSAVCGSRRLELWLCVDLTATTGVLWDGEAFLAMADDPPGTLACEIGGREVVFAYATPATWGDVAVCSGTLPLGRDSAAWLFFAGIEFRASRIHLLDGPQTGAAFAGACATAEWACGPVAWETAGHVATLAACAADVPVLLLGTRTLTLDGATWTCAQTNAGRLVMASTGGEGVGSTAVLRGDHDDVGAWPGPRTELGTLLLDDCDVLLAWEDAAAVRCTRPDRLRDFAYWPALAFAAFAAVCALYPLYEVPRRLLLGGVVAAAAVVSARGLSICRYGALSQVATILILLASVFAAAGGTPAERGAAGAAAAVLAIESCMFAVPHYCHSGVSLVVELYCHAAVVATLLHGHVAGTDPRWRRWVHRAVLVASALLVGEAAREVIWSSAVRQPAVCAALVAVAVALFTAFGVAAAVYAVMFMHGEAVRNGITPNGRSLYEVAVAGSTKSHR